MLVDGPVGDRAGDLKLRPNRASDHRRGDLEPYADVLRWAASGSSSRLSFGDKIYPDTEGHVMADERSARSLPSKLQKCAHGPLKAPGSGSHATLPLEEGVTERTRSWENTGNFID